MVRDWQAKMLYDAEDAAWRVLKREGILFEPTLEEADRLMESISRLERKSILEFSSVGKCKRCGQRHERVKDVELVHELAHLVTSNVFPAHGAEFAANYLRLLKRHCGDRVHDVTLQQFERYGIHFTPEHRLKRVKRVAVNFANNSQPRVCLVADKPPGVWHGDLIYADAETVKLSDDRTIPMSRVRYIEKVKT